jgi:hypothetical protein
MATQQIINIGSSPNDGNGDPLRTAFQKTNQNFSVLFGISGVTGIANGTSNISIPVANSNIVMTVGNVANVVTVLANGMTTLGNHTVSAFVNAGNITSAGTILANGTIQSLGAVTAVTVTASGNLVGSNLNVTNQMRASTLLLTGNVINAELNVSGNVVAAALTSTGPLSVAANTDITGNVTGAYFIGNGSQLTGVTAAPANIFNIINTTGSPLIVADSPNDTLNFTFGNNITITGNSVTDTLDFTFSESPTFTGTVTATTFVGDLKGSVFADDSTLMVDAIDNKLFAGEMVATGNVTANYFLGNGSLLTGVITSVSNITNGTSNVQISAANGNVSFNVDGTADVMIVQSDLVRVNANLQIDGELQYVNVTTLAIKDPIIGMGRNANNTPLTTNDGKDRGSQLWYYDSSEKSAFFGWDNSSGNLIIANDVTVSSEVVTVNGLGTLEVGNLYPANITTPGTIDATGNITAPYFLGNVLGNISGNLVVSGANTEVVFNDGGTANATSGFTFDKSTNAVFIGGNCAVTGNISTGTKIILANNAEIKDTSGNALAIGLGSGATNQSDYALAVGFECGQTNQGEAAVAIGDRAGQTDQGISAVAIGYNAGNTSQGNTAVAIGLDTAQVNQGVAAIAIGNRAGGGTAFLGTGQGNSAVAIGDEAGANNQGNFGIALGFQAGYSNQGNYAIAIGALAGDSQSSSSSIILNATGTSVNAPTVDTFVVAPIRNDVSNTSELLCYNTTSYEVSYANTINIAGNITTAGVISVNSGDALTAIENAGSNAVGNIGSSSSYFNTVFAQSTSALYADLAENYQADRQYDAGTVLSFGGVNEVTESTKYADQRIVGVVSTQPAYRMNAGLQGDHVVTVALAGRVPCRVTGIVERGDMMISAGNGMACACTVPAVGSVIGKAMQDFAGGDGIIEIVVGRI